MDEIQDTAKKVKKISMLVSFLGCLPLFVFFIAIMIAVFTVLGLIDSNDDSGSVVQSNNEECGFTISQTSLSKSEFKKKIQEYANSHSQWQVFVDNADDYYDYAKAKGINPELVVTVAGKEGNGYTTSGANNYWGGGCPNGATVCAGYSSFMEGAKVMIDSAAKSDTIFNWFYIHHYSWIGNYWLNPGGSGVGGCYYASYIYPDNMPARVKNACAEGNECSGSSCSPTVPEEDQYAYSGYLVKVMVGIRKNVFGLEGDEGVACTGGSSLGDGNTLVDKYVNWMIKFAADDSHGYSQNTRQMNPNVDCSSFVYYGLTKGAGIKPDDLGGTYPFTTYDMDKLLKAVGFKAHKFTSIDELKRGDILWSIDHTEVYVGDGKNVGAHTNKDGKDGDSSGTEVNVADNWRNNWTYYYRYES